MNDRQRLQALAKERSDIAGLMDNYHEYKSVAKSLDETRAMLVGQVDDEMKELVKEEINGLETRKNQLEEALKEELMPRDPNDDKNIIMEIRAETGGRRPVFSQPTFSGCTAAMLC